MTSIPDTEVGSRARACVLVVDDDAGVALLVQRALPGHDITMCTSAEEALGRINAGEAYDLILSDLAMPHMSGTAFLRALREAAPQQAEALVFLTGGAYGAGDAAFLDAVPNERMAKPFVLKDLRALVDRRLALGKARAMTSAREVDVAKEISPSTVHRLKNQLAVILGFCELLLADFEDGDKRRADVVQIQTAGQAALATLNEPRAVHEDIRKVR